MKLRRLHKKLFLLLDHRNLLWRDRGFDSAAKVAGFLSINKATFSNWGNGKPPSPEKVGALCEKIIAEVLERLPDSHLGRFSPAELQSMLQDESIALLTFAERVGVAVSQAQQQVDEIIHQRMPLFRSFCFGSDCAHDYIYAKEIVFPIYSGKYKMLRTRLISNEVVLISSALHVRYLMKVSEHPELWAIRCKLSVPVAAEPSADPFQYDGYLSEKRSFVHWVFEQREGADSTDDFIFIISARKQSNGSKIIGQCLTTCGTLDSQKLSAERVLIRPSSDTDDDARVYSRSQWDKDQTLKDCVSTLREA